MTLVVIIVPASDSGLGEFFHLALVACYKEFVGVTPANCVLSYLRPPYNVVPPYYFLLYSLPVYFAGRQYTTYFYVYSKTHGRYCISEDVSKTRLITATHQIARNVPHLSLVCAPSPFSLMALLIGVLAEKTLP